jgi:hypothetical protein
VLISAVVISSCGSQPQPETIVATPRDDVIDASAVNDSLCEFTVTDPSGELRIASTLCSMTTTMMPACANTALPRRRSVDGLEDGARTCIVEFANGCGSAWARRSNVLGARLSRPANGVQDLPQRKVAFVEALQTALPTIAPGLNEAMVALTSDPSCVSVP